MPRKTVKKNSLRIAQVAPLWTRIPPATYGGIEVLMKLLVDELVQRGHDVTLFASGDCFTEARLHPVTELELVSGLQEAGFVARRSERTGGRIVVSATNR